MTDHMSYPHWPGHLYGCPGCDNQCNCDYDEGSMCVHCAIEISGLGEVPN